MVELRWERLSDSHWRALDAGAVRYDARAIRRSGDGTQRWRVTMNGFTIGDKTGYDSLGAACAYVDWGGKPNRMGYDRETGEVFQ